MKVLTIRLGAVGDVVTVYPALAALRRHLPDAELHHLVEEGAASVVRGLSVLDDVLVVERAAIKKQFGRLQFGAVKALRQRLREARYDVVIDFQSLQRSAWFAKWTHAPIRIAKRNWRELNPPFFTQTIVTSSEDNVMLQYLDLLKPVLGASERPAAATLIPPFTDADRAIARAAKLGARYVVLAPGSRWPRRAWPEALIVAVGKVLASRGVPFALIGGPSERHLQRVADEHGWRALLDLSLPALSALIADSAGFVGADSAPMHLADMLNVPSVVVYGPTSAHLYGPLFAPHVDVRAARFGQSHDFRGQAGVDYFADIDASEVVAHLLALQVHR